MKIFQLTLVLFMLFSAPSHPLAEDLLEGANNVVTSTSSSKLISTINLKLISTFTNVKSIIFIVAGFGLVLLSFGAIFGKIKWSAFASLAVGLAILAAAGSVINYATGTKGMHEDLLDTFSNAAPLDTPTVVPKK